MILEASQNIQQMDNMSEVVTKGDYLGIIVYDENRGKFEAWKAS